MVEGISQLVSRQECGLDRGMSPARFVECREALHWSDDQLAEIFGCDEGLIEAWALGLEEIPPKAAAWLETLLNVHEVAEAAKPTELRGRKAQGPTLN